MHCIINNALKDKSTINYTSEYEAYSIIYINIKPMTFEQYMNIIIQLILCVCVCVCVCV